MFALFIMIYFDYTEWVYEKDIYESQTKLELKLSFAFLICVKYLYEMLWTFWFKNQKDSWTNCYVNSLTSLEFC